MKSSHSLRFTLEAEEDIRQILQYTRDTWGEAQRDRYEAALERVFYLLIDFPDLGRKRFGDHVLSYRAREHVIYYRISSGEIAVLRVLHKKQDIREVDLPMKSLFCAYSTRSKIFERLIFRVARRSEWEMSKKGLQGDTRSVTSRHGQTFDVSIM